MQILCQTGVNNCKGYHILGFRIFGTSLAYAYLFICVNCSKKRENSHNKDRSRVVKTKNSGVYIRKASRVVKREKFRPGIYEKIFLKKILKNILTFIKLSFIIRNIKNI